MQLTVVLTDSTEVVQEEFEKLSIITLLPLGVVVGAAVVGAAVVGAAVVGAVVVGAVVVGAPVSIVQVSRTRMKLVIEWWFWQRNMYAVVDAAGLAGTSQI